MTSSTKPIRMDIEIEAVNCQVVSGDVTLNLIVDGSNAYQMTKKIAAESGSSDRTGRETESDGLRQRQIASTSEMSEMGNLNESDADMSKFHSFRQFAKDTAQNIADKVWECVHYAHLPAWLRDCSNELLHHGHRPEMPSFRECFLSIFRMHNETGNIWSHLLGCVLFVGLAISFMKGSHHWQEKIVLSPFFVGVIACLATSFLYHTVCCHSPEVARFFCKLDYVGISILNFGAFWPLIFYGFYCQRGIRIFLGILMAVLTSITFILTVFDTSFSNPKNRFFRSSVFVVLGGLNLIPFARFVIEHGFHTSTPWLASVVGFFSIGTVIYTTQFPEIYFPGKCDYWFQSHQVWHLLTIVAALSLYRGLYEMAAKRLSEGCP